MDLKISLIVAFSCILITDFVWSETEPRTIQVTNTSVLAQQGSVVKLSCRYDAKPSALIQYGDKINWMHQKYGSKEVTYITKTTDYAEGADKTKYGQKATVADNYVLFEITVNDIRPDDDGYFICELREGDALKMIQTVNFTVISPIEKLSFTLKKSNDPSGYYTVMSTNTRDGNKSKRVQLDEGKYDFECTASGSNPPPEVTLTENAVLISQGVTPTTGLIQQDKQLYQTTVVKRQITINRNSIDKKYECVGVNPKATTKKVIKAAFSILDVNTKLAVVKCQNVSAILGDQDRLFNCSVKVNKGKISCKDVVWVKEHPDPGSEKTYNHDMTEKSLRKEGVALNCKNINDTMLVSKLVINRVGEKVFGETYTVIFNNPSYSTVRKENQMIQYFSGAEYMGGCISLIACLIIAIMGTYL